MRRRIADLVPHARNARTHSPEQVEQIAASIGEWGWTVPVLVDEHDNLLAGHGRVLAAEKLGLLEVPAMIARGWSEAQKRAYVIADNKLALNSGWDLALLQAELADLRELGAEMAVIGFSEAELVDLVPDGELLGEQKGVDGSAFQQPTLRWADKEVRLSADELDGLNSAFARHYAEHGVAYGFVNHLLRDV